MTMHRARRAGFLIAALAAPLFAASPVLAQAREAVVLCQTLEPPTLDPTAGAAAAIKEVTYDNVFETLIGLDRSAKLVPRLAESWSVSPDGLAVSLKLRAGVTFHDGAPFTSADVKFSFERAAAPDSKNAQKWIFTPIAAIETPDAANVVFKLKSVAADFLFGLSRGDASILSAASAAKAGTEPVGTGPYKFVRWNRGDRLLLTRNDAWWGGKAAIKDATFRFIADPQAQVVAIQAGDCDTITNIAAPESVETLKANKALTVMLGNTEGETILAMNNKKPGLADVRVRRAIAHAIDRKAIIEGAMSGLATPIGSHFSPNHPAYVDLTGVRPYDPAKAKALLAEAGVKDLALAMRLPPPAYARRSGEIIAAMLGEVGIKVSIEQLEWPQWLERVFKNKDYDLSIVAHVEPNDLNIYSRPEYYFNYQNDAFNALIGKVAVTLDDAARNALLVDGQKMLAEEQPNAFLFMLPKITVSKAGLKGMWPNWPQSANPLAELSWQ